MSKRELYDPKDKKRLDIYKIRFSKEERKLLEAKKEQYGYKHLSEYIRDVAIYESVIQINVSYTDEVTRLFQEYIDETRKLTKEVRRILKYNTSATLEEQEKIQQALYRVYSQTKSLKKSVNDNINVDEIIEQSKKRLYEKQLKEIEKEFSEIIK